jgi:hypothetical protein
MKVLRVELGTGGSLATALRCALRLLRERADVVVAPSAGGPAGLVRFRPVVTMVADGDPATGGTRRWLERTQARRSRLLYADRRASAVAFALHWGIAPTKFRISDANGPSDEQLRRDMLALRSSRRRWHST